MNPLLFRLCSIVVLTAVVAAGTTFAAESFPVTIKVDAAQSRGDLRLIWKYFGADEPNYAYMKDGEKLLDELGRLRPGDVYFRAHNLMNTGPAEAAFKWGSTNLYTEDAQGNPVYDFSITDLIFDTYLERGVRPLVEVGFMPQALSTQPEPYRHEWRPGFPYSGIYTGWRMPPKDYDKWGEVVYQWAKHCVEKYGMAEVEKWWWETWNEADNQPNGYWGGTAEEFFKLHDYTVAAVRRAIPRARVGGPHSANARGNFTVNFLEHCVRGTNYATGQVGTPLDYISFHAKGSPTFVQDGGFVRMGISNHLRNVDAGFAAVARFPELKNTPIIIGESDPEGCAACQGAQLAYRNGTMYSSYTAASFARKHDLADKHGINFEGALTWAFTFENQPYFAGFRQLASNGIPLAVLNVFRMFSQMSGQRIAAESSAAIPLDAIVRDGVRGAPDVAAFASFDAAARRLCVMAWHYHDDDVAGPDAAVELALTGLPTAANGAPKLTHYRIDEFHSNPYGAWNRMGSPHAPNERQYAELLAASALTALEDSPASTTVANGAATLQFNLPRQGVSLLVLDWGAR